MKLIIYLFAYITLILTFNKLCTAKQCSKNNLNEDCDDQNINDNEKSQQHNPNPQISEKNFTKPRIILIHSDKTTSKPIYEYFSQRNRSEWRAIYTDDWNTNFEKVNILWKMSPVDINRLKSPNILWNHLPKQFMFHNKGLFLKTLRYFDSLERFTFNSNRFIPQTYILNLTQPFLNEEEKEFINGNLSGIWIEKPVHSSQGNGIAIITNISEYRQNLASQKPKDFIVLKKFDTMSKVIQKYIEKIPLLDGRKFDIRCYLIIAWSYPMLAFYRDGYIRRTMKNYNLNNFDRNIHLTNFAVQRKSKGAKEGNETASTMEEFRGYLKYRENKTDSEVDEIFIKMKEIITYTLLSQMEFNIDKKAGFFQIFGVDIMFDANYNPIILEVNADPFMLKSTRATNTVISGLVNDTFNLVTYLYDNKDNIKEILEKEDNLPKGKLELLLNEASGFNYIDKYKRNIEKQNKEEL